MAKPEFHVTRMQESVFLRMKFFHLFLFLCLSLEGWSQAYSGPESVDCDTITGNYYISNTGSKKILRRTPEGELQEFLSGFSSGPHGIEVVGDRIYACDGNKIKGFLLSDGMPVFTVTTSASFLNGITHDAAGNLYASDFSGKKIYKINTSNVSWNIFVPQTTATPNGLLFDPLENRLVCVTWGASAKLLGISLADSSVSILKTTTLSNIDGVARDGSGRWYVASWGANAVHRIAADFSGTPQQVLGGLSQPADIYYNLKTDTLAVPNAGNNTVVFTGFTPVSSIPEVESLTGILVFPNPATDKITIQLPQNEQLSHTDIQVFDIEGRSFQLPVIQDVSGQKVCSVRHLPQGIYRLSLQQGAQKISTTFLRL